MTINWWTLALQAINVLILVWLLSRLFWRPVAAAIAQRQATTQATLDAASEARAKADAALVEVRETRAGLAAERAALLADAQTKAEAAAKAALADAQSRADALLAAAQTAIDRDTAAARKDNAAQAAELSVEIAARLLSQLNSPMVQAAHLEVLVKAIAEMPAPERKALVAGPAQIEIVSATAPTVADKAEIKESVIAALGGSPRLKFVTDPELIAGLELRSAHFVLHNSWRADLNAILKEMKDAAS
ncbi:F0F1 ATP synthase subunit delta [uncultured Hoeflea sp.]|uniref:F0F1 ATP synthase subunit delta n=1 Tax=uncultured Hoeflea sp. TaxID=538666 RepID=UPI0030DBD25E|tara:strand:+ start:626 stop:1366 length:741 start_codon:yes stop_codon:yes gene_type:complete